MPRQTISVPPPGLPVVVVMVVVMVESLACCTPAERAVSPFVVFVQMVAYASMAYCLSEGARRIAASANLGKDWVQSGARVKQKILEHTANGAGKAGDSHITP